jgi:hypothetical protein
VNVACYHPVVDRPTSRIEPANAAPQNRPPQSGHRLRTRGPVRLANLLAVELHLQTFLAPRPRQRPTGRLPLKGAARSSSSPLRYGHTGICSSAFPVACSFGPKPDSILYDRPTSYNGGTTPQNRTPKRISPRLPPRKNIRLDDARAVVPIAMPHYGELDGNPQMVRGVKCVSASSDSSLAIEEGRAGASGARRQSRPEILAPLRSIFSNPSRRAVHSSTP